MTYSVDNIANMLLISFENMEDGELLTNMKLQKMLYYQQGFHLAYFDEPLFEEEIEAWLYGPVVKSIYTEYKRFGKKGIAGNHDTDFTFVNDIELALFNEVNKVYGRYSAIGLMEMTHKETPWNSVPIGEGSIITKDCIKAFFLTRLKQ
ncbi:MAG: DUF4065 domain-containing protein [Bacteroidales bacterium]|nr:DUF4065 domain-containing protein [Bacteroidales bacterium]